MAISTDKRRKVLIMNGGIQNGLYNKEIAIHHYANP